jgi:DNA/RNA endonuclease G (NUC1)
MKTNGRLTILIIVFLTLILISKFTYCQNIDTVIKTPIYTSYFSYETKTPLYCVGKIYKVGGKLPRTGLTFKTGGVLNSATEKDYAHNGYDEGHLFPNIYYAFDAVKQESTFRFYNALPQTANLNRGCWKHLESDLLKLSQDDSLLIIAGGFQFDSKMGTAKVPAYCYKIVKDLKTKMINCYLFSNTSNASEQTIPLQTLLNELGYKNNILELLK